MKIAIIGAHSTGKSTIIKHLSLALDGAGYSVQVLKELSRQCPFPIDRSTTYKAQHWIQQEHFKREPQLLDICDILICDRSSLDNFAYMQRAVTDRDLTDDEMQSVTHMQTYNHVFKTIKLNLPPEDDGIRDLDEPFRNDIDMRIQTLLQKHNVPHTRLPETLDYGTHVHFILDHLGITVPTVVGAQ